MSKSTDFDIFQKLYFFKFYLWEVALLRSYFQIKYLLFSIITHHYYAYVVPFAFAWRSSCWPLSSNQQPETDVYFVTIHHKCSKLCVVFLKIYMYMRVKFQGTVSNSFDFTRQGNLLMGCTMYTTKKCKHAFTWGLYKMSISSCLLYFNLPLVLVYDLDI